MADQNPVTFTPLGETPSGNQPSTQGAPKGVTFTPITPDSGGGTAAPTQPSGHHVTDTAFGPNEAGFNPRTLGNAVVSGVGGALEGAGEGVFSTVAGAADLANKIPGVHIPTDKLHELAGDKEQQTTAEKIGYGGETLLEFVLGDEALKGLSQSEKLMQAAKTMKILENSPRTMMALKAGAEGLRAGAVQGAQTFVRTSGDTQEALKQGKEMAEIAGPLGIVGQGVAKLGEGITKGVEAQKAMDAIAQTAQSKAVITGDIGDKINASEQALHSNYENSINDYKDRLAGHELDPTDKTLPVAQKAEELLQNPVPGDHQIEKKLKDLGKEGLKPQVRDILENLKNGYDQPVDLKATIDIPLPKNTGEAVEGGLPGKTTNKVTMNKYQYWDGKNFSTDPVTGDDLVDLSKLDSSKIDFTNGTYKGEVPDTAIVHKLDPYTVDNLIGIRQLIRKRAAEFDYGDTNARTLKSLLGSVDDTLGKLADQAGDPTLSQEYAALRKDYGDKINIYNDPIVNALREKKYGDATKEIMGGSNRMAPRLQQLETILGQPVMDDLRKNMMRTLIDNSAGPHGETNPARLLDNYNKIPEASREVLFNKGVPSSVIQELMKDAHTARNLQYLSRLGVIGPVVAGSPFVYHMGVLGSLLTMSAEGGALYGASRYGGVRQVIDYIADHPKMWKAWGMLGKTLETGAGAAGTAVKGGIGQAVTGTNQKPYSFKDNGPITDSQGNPVPGTEYKPNIGNILSGASGMSGQK